MSIRSLFLAWQDTDHRRWFTIGQLRTGRTTPRYAFGYTRGATLAANDVGFEPLYDFPEFDRVYQSDHLFPLFANRVMNPNRKSFAGYLNRLAIDESDPDPLEILAIDGGRRMTDRFEVFPQLQRGADGRFRSRFFLHGSRHASDAAQKRLTTLQPDDELYVTLELTNPKTRLAVQLQTTDYHMIGWAPRYLVHDLVEAMTHAPSDYQARVVRVTHDSPWQDQNILIELAGRWPDEYEPMSADEYQALAADWYRAYA